MLCRLHMDERRLHLGGMERVGATEQLHYILAPFDLKVTTRIGNKKWPIAWNSYPGCTNIVGEEKEIRGRTRGKAWRLFAG